MRLALVLILGVCFCSFTFAADTSSDMKTLFNGKDLAGWKPTDPKQWRAENGILIGEQLDPKGKGSMIYTTDTFKDVVVECEVRFGENIDSGIMLRKPEIQLQFGVSRSLKKDMTCSIYAHGKYPGVAQGVDKLLKLNEWNHVRFEARGDVFQAWLNGQHVLTYTDPKFPNPGPIGLQVHGGVKMKVEFRNIKARSLETASARAE